MPNDVRRILSLFAIELQEGPDHSDIFCRFPDHPIAALLAVLMPHKAITVVVHCGYSLSLHCCVLHSICLVHLATPAVSEICSILTYPTVIKTSILSYATVLSRKLASPIVNSVIGCAPWHRYSFSDMNALMMFR